MIEQASVSQIRSGEVSCADGRIVIAMRFHPRGLRRELRDEYRADLAPEKRLFKDFKRFQASLGHDAAFEKADYYGRFALDAGGLAALERLSRERGRIYLVCQCAVGERCHREILMLLARKRFGARIGKVHHRYPRTRVLTDRP
jgi:uncharacterized protein YeaO (DUF488 family)